MALDQAELSRRPKQRTARDLADHIVNWFAAIRSALVQAARYFFCSRDLTSHVNAAPSADRQAASAAPTIPQITEKVSAAPSAPGMQVDSITCVALDNPDHAEIQRRRDLVRMLFNDYWSGAHEKPAVFSERLDQAEEYLNDRLAATGEIWRLDASTRKILGLPPRSRSAG